MTSTRLEAFSDGVLSFVYAGIYWKSHHHMLHPATRVGGGVLWANLHLLFWLSLLPFVTGWMGENHFAAMPTALYGCVLLMAAIAYWILQRLIMAPKERKPCWAMQRRSRLHSSATGFRRPATWLLHCYGWCRTSASSVRCRNTKGEQPPQGGLLGITARRWSG
jgi:hypothetical protein